ncbi:MAG: glycosyltransferase [Bdellovibrio sp.]|nr:glycosyltransferase [Bdellovibrio sp.]
MYGENSRPLSGTDGRRVSGGMRILHLLRGHRWGTIERESLRSIQWQKTSGTDAVIYLDRKSPLDQALKQRAPEAIKIYPRQSLHTSWTGRIGDFFWLRKIIKQYNIQLVHAYSLDDLILVGLALRTSPEIPFVLSINHEIVKSHRKIWLRPFVERIDRFVVHNPELLENIWTEMKIHPRKGLVLWPSPTDDTEDNPIISQERPDSHMELVIGSYVTPLLRNMDAPQAMFAAITVLKEKTKQPIRLKIFVDRLLTKSYFVEHLHTFSRPWAKSFMIEICEFDGLYPPFASIHLWWTLSDEIIEDFSLLALKTKVPIVAPKMSSYIELKRKQPWIGELYKKNDIREMWSSAYKISDNLMDYHENLALDAKVFLPAWIEMSAQEKLLNLYDRGIRLRKLLNARKSI